MAFAVGACSTAAAGDASGNDNGGGRSGDRHPECNVAEFEGVADISAFVRQGRPRAHRCPFEEVEEEEAAQRQRSQRPKHDLNETNSQGGDEFILGELD